MCRRIVVFVVLLTLVLAVPRGLLAALDPSPTDVGPPVAASQRGVEVSLMGQMPLCFIENRGVTDPSVAYYVQGKDKTLYFTPEGVTFVLSDGSRSIAPGGRFDPKTENGHKALDYGNPTTSYVLKLDFVGANPDVVPVGEEQTEAVISYFKGPRSEWKTGLGTFSRIVYRDLWSGIDLAYSGTINRLKYEFVVHPGADPTQIRLTYRGADSVVNDEARLVVTAGTTGFEDDAPVAWQEVAGERREVEVGYEVSFSSPPYPGERLGEGEPDPLTPTLSPSVLGARGADTYSFHLGDYDASLPLVIDPAVLIYCGYIGGSGTDDAGGIAVDGAGCAYVCGKTTSLPTTFPEVVGPDLSFNGGNHDAFVAKVKADGSGLVYCGYIGGSDDDRAGPIAVDGSGCAYVTGATFSDETAEGFPVTVGPDLTFNDTSHADAFVAKVKANGTDLTYCGYIGGTDSEKGNGIGVDESGHAYIGGSTFSNESAGAFPVEVGPDLTHNGLEDAFVAKVEADGSGLVYCGYVGGDNNELASCTAVDDDGCAYLAGWTSSNETAEGFPVAAGPDLTHNGDVDAFVAKVEADGSGLVFCGYIGGSAYDDAWGIAVDGAGAVYVSGGTESNQTLQAFPALVGPDVTFNNGRDAYVAKVKPDGTALDYCGYIGGAETDSGSGIAVDTLGRATVAGRTNSNEIAGGFPAKVGPDLTYNGGIDAFVARVKSDGTDLIYCGYIGGSLDDYGGQAALDRYGEAYVTGHSLSSEAAGFPVTVGPDLTYNSNDDAFVAKVDMLPTAGSITPAADAATVGTTKYFTTTWSDLDGFTDEKWCIFIVGSTPSMANTVYLCYNNLRNTLMIRKDDGSVWWGGKTPGTLNTIQNQFGASVNCALTTVTKAGNTITVRWAVTFKATFTGAKNLYLRALDLSGKDTGTPKKGTVVVAP